MCCSDKIPKYLHQEDKKVLDWWRFRYYHLLYRVGFKPNGTTEFREGENPVGFPNSSTAVSTCWSKLIDDHDVLKTILSMAKNPDRIGDYVFFGRIREVRKLRIKMSCEEGEYKGTHKLVSIIRHRPEPCNYSHAEILIKYRYPNNSKFETIVIEHQDWKTCLLNKGKPKVFFKELNLKYRAKLATIMNSDIILSKVPRYMKFIPKKWAIRIIFAAQISIS